VIVGVRISCLSERLLWVFGECVGAACGRVWCGFAGIELCVGEIGVSFWGVSVCCVWERLVWDCGE